MKLVLDVMGGDHAPHEIVAGAVQFARQSGHTIVLVGQEQVVRAELAKHDITGLDLPVVHAAETLQMDEKPALAARRKKDNSMAVGMRLVKDGKGDAFCTMGHTGGALTAGHMVFRGIPGVHRAVLATPFPNSQGFHMLGDIGANPECRPEWLAQWGQMLAIYAHARLGVAHPRVALLSNGEEEGKGTELTRASEPLLRELLGDSFIGVVEPKEMMAGAADAVVTDGFTGNVTIKLSEAIASYIFSVQPLLVFGGPGAHGGGGGGGGGGGRRCKSPRRSRIRCCALARTQRYRYRGSWASKGRSRDRLFAQHGKTSRGGCAGQDSGRSCHYGGSHVLRRRRQ